MRKSLLGAVAVAALMLPGVALAQSGTIKIGILVALEGAFATGGQDGVRNVELALKQVNNTIAGKRSKPSSLRRIPNPTRRSVWLASL